MRITRLFIDNYKCFVGFDFKPQAIQPIFGLNGTGKSTLFGVLEVLRHFLIGRNHSKNLFPASTLTRWRDVSQQTFRIETDSDDFRFEYELILNHDRSAGYARVHSETLTSDAELVFHRSVGETRYIRDDGTRAPGALLDVRYSGIGLDHPAVESKRLNAFRRWARSQMNVAVNPWTISSRSEDEEKELDWGGANLTSWLRYLDRTRPSVLAELNDDLAEVIDGFVGLKLVEDGHARLLRVLIRHLGGPLNEYDFGELSDGQRQLVVLYAILRGHERDAVLCMDEPANYLALAEIQPYLVRLRDAVGDGLAQLFVVTHNSEAIDYMAPDGPAMFARGDDGAIRIEPFPDLNPKGLTASQLMALGWKQP